VQEAELSDEKHTHCPYCDADGLRLEQTLRIAKEHNVARLDLYESGAPMRIEFGPERYISKPDADGPEEPAQPDPSEYESALTRMASGKRKGKAQ
jgi:hypothetical protein